MKTDQSYSIINGTIILSLGILISRIIGFAYRIPIQKILGDEGNGLYGEAYQIYSIILTITAIAIPSALSKLIAETEALEAYSESTRIFKIALKYCLMGAGVIGIVVILGADALSDLAFPNDNIGLALRIFAPTAVIATAVASLRGYFQGLGNMKPTAISQILEQILNVIISIVLAYQFSKISLMAGVAGSCMGTSVGALTALLVLSIGYRSIQKNRPTKPKIAYTAASETVIFKKILTIVLPVIISTSVFSIMTFIDYSMISNMLPNSILKLQEKGLLYLIPLKNIETLDLQTIVARLKGQYSFQYNTFINIPVSLVLQLAVAAIPALSIDVIKGNVAGVNRKIQLILRSGLLIAVPASIAFMIFGVPLMELILGKTASGGELLAVGGIGLIVITIAQLTAGILQGIGQAKIASRNAIIACGIKVIFNFILISIPQLTIYSVILSTIICYAIYSVLNVNYISHKIGIYINWNTVLLRPLFCSLIMGITSYLCYSLLQYVLSSNRLCMLITIPIAMGIYFIVGYKTKTITQADLNSLPFFKK